MSFESRRVNIFIGEPNTGKSNLLEALGIFSLNSNNYQRILRYRNIYDLFFDNEVSEPISINAEPYTMSISSYNENCEFRVSDSNTTSYPELGGRL